MEIALLDTGQDEFRMIRECLPGLTRLRSGTQTKRDLHVHRRVSKVLWLVLSFTRTSYEKGPCDANTSTSVTVHPYFMSTPTRTAARVIASHKRAEP